MKEGSIGNEGESAGKATYLEWESGRGGQATSYRSMKSQSSRLRHPQIWDLVKSFWCSAWVWGRFLIPWWTAPPLHMLGSLGVFEAHKIKLLLCLIICEAKHMFFLKILTILTSFKIRVFDKHIRLFEKGLSSTLSIIDKGLKFHGKIHTLVKPLYCPELCPVSVLKFEGFWNL